MNSISSGAASNRSQNKSTRRQQAGRLVFHIFGALAEFERGIIRERTLRTIKAARARGRKGGRPKLMTDENIIVAKALLHVRHADREDVA